MPIQQPGPFPSVFLKLLNLNKLTKTTLSSWPALELVLPGEASYSAGKFNQKRKKMYFRPSLARLMCRSENEKRPRQILHLRYRPWRKRNNHLTRLFCCTASSQHNEPAAAPG